MPQTKHVANQRKLVIEQLKKTSNPIIFELLSDILSIEREHRDHKHGVKEAIKDVIDRTAQHDVPEYE